MMTCPRVPWRDDVKSAVYASAAMMQSRRSLVFLVMLVAVAVGLGACGDPWEGV